MFLKIRMKNFYSFKDVTFDLQRNSKEFKRLAIVYGENGAGKTNLMSGLSVFIDLMRTMDVRDLIETILSSQERHKSTDESRHKVPQEVLARFLRSSETLFAECKMIGSAEPVFLEYDFLINGKKGSYTVEFGEEGISHERLEYALEKRRGVYFDLSTGRKVINNALFKNPILRSDVGEQLKKFWGKHTFLAIIIHELNDKATQYMKEGLLDNFYTVLESFSKVSCDINKNNNPHALISRPASEFLLTDMEEGVVSKNSSKRIARTEKVLTQLFHAINGDNKSLYYKINPNGEDELRYQLRIKKNISGEERDLPFEYESYGNHQIVRMLPFLLRALTGETVILDETDLGIHDLLYSKIIQEAQPYINGQLILTTHNTLFLETQEMKEAIYLIKENEKADHFVVPISNNGERIYQQTSMRNKYLNGAYGGVPQVETIDFKTLLSIAEEDSN